MSDENMPDSEPDSDEIRKRIIQRFWKLLGTEPTTAASVVRATGEPEVDAYNDVLGVAEADEDDPFDYFLLNDYTLEKRMIIRFFYGAATLTGDDSTVAYDFGDRWWYVIRHNDDDTPWLMAAVPKADPAPFFDELRVEWVKVDMDGALWFHALTVIEGYDLTSTPMARLLIDATMRVLIDGGEPVATQVEALHEATCSWLILGQESGSDIDDEDLRTSLGQSWGAIVIADPPLAIGDPPGLMTLSVDSPEFDEYLSGVTLRWRDTSELIDLRTAQLLRVVLQYLVAACSGVGDEIFNRRRIEE